MLMSTGAGGIAWSPRVEGFTARAEVPQRTLQGIAEGGGADTHGCHAWIPCLAWQGDGGGGGGGAWAAQNNSPASTAMTKKDFTLRHK